MRRAILAVTLTALAVVALQALPSGQSPAEQTGCRAPAPEPAKVVNIFTPAQESDLGDAMAETFVPWLRVVDDSALNARLEAIGAKLVSHLPPTDLKFRFQLMEIPDANAFALAGGRIFVSRKLVAFVQSEDELAGVLGHELGHVVARQHTIEMTRQLREVTGVTQVGDRNDIFAKFNQLMDNAGRKPGAFNSSSREGRDQIEADRIGLFIVAASGYDPRASITMFDRLFETGGKTGTFLSKMLGTTNSDAKRLGELTKAAGTVPANCVPPANPARAAEFREWQGQVAAYTLRGRKENVPGLISQKALTPIRAEITHLKFSPDGKYVLAQDDAGVSVLSREPLAVLFRINSGEAEDAQFSSDSTEVLVHTNDLRIEKWNIAAKKLSIVRDLFRPAGCVYTSVSPDGKTAACLNRGEELSLIDVSNGQPFFVKKNFQLYDPLAALYNALSGLGTARFGGNVTLTFSPDGKYFAGTSVGYQVTNTVVYDVAARAPITLKGAAKPLLSTTFTFIGPDRILGFNGVDPSKSGIVRLPAGDVAEQFAVPQGTLSAPARGNVVFLRPYQRYAVAVFDLTKKTVSKGNPAPAMDVFDDVYLAERGSGDVAVYEMLGNQLKAAIAVPSTELGRLRAATVSPDFNWVAVSAPTRGIFWNATTGERVSIIRPFDGSFADDTGALFVNMPRTATEPRGVVKLDSKTRAQERVSTTLDQNTQQFGQQFLIWRHIPPDVVAPTGVEFEMRDVRNGQAMWRKSYPKNPPDDYWPHATSDGFVLSWEADSPAGREMIRLNQDLRERAKLGDIAGDFILQVIDNRTGAIRGHLLVETGKGSFHVDGAVTTGDYVAVTDSLNRVLLYSLKSNELKGYAFGVAPLVNATSNTLAVSAGMGRIVLYDLQTLKARREFQFGSDVVLKSLSPDGERMFVLTADQQARVVSTK